MSTETKAAVSVIVKTSAKVIAAIKAQVLVAVSLMGKQAFTAETIRKESDRMGYDEKQARQMAVLCWREAAGFNAKAYAKEKGITVEEAVKHFDNSKKPDVSKVMTLAFPVKSHEADLVSALAFNESLGSAKHGRISVGRLESIARGKLSFADAKEGKSAPKGNGRTPAPTAPVKLTAETLENALAALRAQYCKPSVMTPKAIREIANKVFCDGPYKPEAKEEVAE